MSNFVKVPFSGTYRLFFPSTDVDEHAQETIKLAAKKIFGDSIKVYFTDDEEAELLQESSSVAQNTSPIIPLVVEEPLVVSEDLLAKTNALRVQRGLPAITSKKPVTVEQVNQKAQEAAIGAVSHDLGADPKWIGRTLT